MSEVNYRGLYWESCEYAGKLRGRIDILEQRFRVLKAYKNTNITDVKAMKEIRDLLKYWEIDDES